MCAARGRILGALLRGGWLVACVAPLAFFGACDGERAIVPPAELTTEPWAPTPPPPEEWPEEDPEPFDVRLARMFPEAFVGLERICDLTHVGALQGLPRRAVQDYPEPVSHRRTVRCQAASGAGWADLVFPKASAGLAPFVEHGQRIRVRVLEGVGFEGYPVIAFVANVGEAPAPPPPTPLHAPLPAGADFDRLAREGHLQTARPCALAHVGPPAPTPDEAPYPGDAPVHAVVHCRHALGEAPVDLAFPRAKALAALRLERAQVIPVALHAPRGGEGGVPIALYAGP
ncbi:MAG: hypothetical protein CMN29_01380 [Sandaracinus sp.]|nr:hypothetical protein [Sandaracinus sp.]